MEIKHYEDSLETKCVSCGESILVFNNDSVHFNNGAVGKLGFVCSKCEGIESRIAETKIGFSDLNPDELEEMQRGAKELLKFYKSKEYKCNVCGKELKIMRDSFNIDESLNAFCKGCIE